jgi:hypothetical protein
MSGSFCETEDNSIKYVSRRNNYPNNRLLRQTKQNPYIEVIGFERFQQGIWRLEIGFPVVPKLQNLKFVECPKIKVINPGLTSETMQMYRSRSGRCNTRENTYMDKFYSF